MGTQIECTERPLSPQGQGLQQTASGYGRKLTTPYMVRIGRRWHRVYCTQYSNAGSLWIQSAGTRFGVDIWRDDSNTLRAELN